MYFLKFWQMRSYTLFGGYAAARSQREVIEKRMFLFVFVTHVDGADTARSSASFCRIRRVDSSLSCSNVFSCSAGVVGSGLPVTGTKGSKSCSECGAEIATHFSRHTSGYPAQISISTCLIAETICREEDAAFQVVCRQDEGLPFPTACSQQRPS